MISQKLFQTLKTIRDRALAPYSDFKVGALLVTSKGEVFTGHNIETSSYGLTICAERVALFKALSEGEREFVTLYILAGNNQFCPPCGACRQVLMDYAPQIRVILLNENGDENEYGLSDLLPVAFTSAWLKPPGK